MATHSRVIIEVVSQVQKRKKWFSAGWKSTPRWAWLRCRNKVTEKIVSWVNTSSTTSRPGQPRPTRPEVRNCSKASGMSGLVGWKVAGAAGVAT